MEGIFFNYLNRTWIVKILKRYGIMNRTETEAMREALLRRKLSEYNRIQRKESKLNRRSRKLIVKEIEDLARRGIVNLTPVKNV